MKMTVPLVIFLCIIGNLAATGSSDITLSNTKTNVFVLSEYSEEEILDYYLCYTDGFLPDESIKIKIRYEMQSRDTINDFLDLVFEKMNTMDLIFDEESRLVSVYDFARQTELLVQLDDYRKLALIELYLELVTLSNERVYREQYQILPVVVSSIHDYVNNYKRVDGTVFLLELYRRKIISDSSHVHGDPISSDDIIENLEIDDLSDLIVTF